VHHDKRVHLVRGDRCLFDVHGRSAEQRIAIDLLADPSVGIVSIGDVVKSRLEELQHESNAMSEYIRSA